MTVLSRAFYSLVMAVLLLHVAGVRPVEAQQPTSPLGSSGSMGSETSPFTESSGQSLSVPARRLPQAPPVTERARPGGRHCAAEAHWPRVPVAPQPWPQPWVEPSVPQVVGVPREEGRAILPPAGRSRSGRTQGVGSITTQDLIAAVPPQQFLTPGIDPARAVPAGPPQGQGGLSPLLGARAGETPRELVGAQPPGQVPASGPDVREASRPLVHETLSPIEQAFGELRQFGYAVFSSPVSTFAPVDDVPVGPDYVVGPGDDLVVNISGMVDGEFPRTVDRNGRIILPKVGPVRVWGLTFLQADRLIREELARYFRGFSTTVTLGRLRAIRVHVVGEVCQPGSYVIGSLSTLTNALFAAGGPTRLGSLREIRLLRNHHLVGALDLYDFLLRGDRTKDFRLESGDTIFVPILGSTVGIEGEVKRPAIYELREPMRVKDAILMAGGVTPRSLLKRVQLVRQQPSAERLAIDVDLTGVFTGGDEALDLAVQNGDLVRVFPSDHRVYNVVHLTGAVKYPGDYELKPEMRLSQLLPRKNMLPEAHLDRVEIVRRRPDLSTEIVTLDLKQVWEGNPAQDLTLRPLDEVTVRTELRSIGTVTLEGEVKRPGQYSIVRGERLSSVIRRAGGFTDRAYLKGAVFTRASLRMIEQEQLNTFVKVQEQRLIAAAGEAVVGLEKVEAAQPLQIFQARRELLRALASRVAVGRMVVQFDQPEKLENTAYDLVLEDSDTLRVPEQPSSVLVVGSVRTSTSVQYKEGVGMDYYVGRVGGFTREADKKEIHIVKADGSAMSGFANIRSVEPGDTIVVPPKEEEKIRPLSVYRDLVTIFAQTLVPIISLAALAALL